MLYDSTHTGTRKGKFLETGGRMLGAGARGNGELVLNGRRVSVWDEEKVLEMDGVMAA